MNDYSTRQVGATTIGNKELLKLLGIDWKKQKPKFLDFSGDEFYLNSLGSNEHGHGLINEYLDISNLEYLKLSNNNLSSDNGTFSSSNSTKFAKLRKLDLSNNNIYKLSSDISLPSLTEIYLNYNNFSSIPELKGLQKLEVLEISNNNIEVPYNSIKPWITLQNCPNLKRLDLSHNNISVLPSVLASIFELLSESLTYLNLEGNPLCIFFPEYRSLAITCCKSLAICDGTPVTNLTRQNIPLFDLGLLKNYDDVYDIRSGRSYNPTYTLQFSKKLEMSHGRLDYLCNTLEQILEEGTSVKLSAYFLQGCEVIYNESMRQWSTDYGGDLGDIDPFEAHRFINIFKPSSKSHSDRVRDTEKLIELVSLVIERQDDYNFGSEDLSKIWILTGLARLIHIPAGGLAIAIARYFAIMMIREGFTQKISEIISSIVLPGLQGRSFSDPIVQTVLASISILPPSNLFAKLMSKHIPMLLDFAARYARTEFHRPLIIILSMVSLYPENAIALSGYGVPSDLASTLVLLNLIMKEPEVKIEKEKFIKNRPTQKKEHELQSKWSSLKYILNSDDIKNTQNINCSGNLASGSTFSILKMVKLLAKRRDEGKSIIPSYVNGTSEMDSSSFIIPEFAKLSNLQLDLIVYYLKIIRNCCNASNKASTLCTDIGLHSKFLMPLLQQFLSKRETRFFSEIMSKLCSEIINVLTSLLNSNEIVLMQLVINFHIIDWVLIPLKEVPFANPGIASAAIGCILTICKKPEIESFQYSPLHLISRYTGSSYNIYTYNTMIDPKDNLPVNSENILHYIVEQMDYLYPQLEFLNFDQNFREMLKYYNGSFDNTTDFLESSQVCLAKIVISEKIQKFIFSLLKFLAFFFQNKDSEICSKVVDGIYSKGYCTTFIRLLEVPGEDVPMAAMDIISMVDLSMIDSSAMNEFFVLVRYEVGIIPDKKASNENQTVNYCSINSQSNPNRPFKILSSLWLPLLIYIRRLIDTVNSNCWCIFRDNFAPEIAYIIFCGLQYSWQKLILSSSFSKIMLEISSEQSNEVFVILASCRVVRALSRYNDFRKYLRDPNLRIFFEYSLKKEELNFGAYDPDTSLEISWCGRSLEWLLGTLSGQNRLSAEKKLATRVFCRIADIMEGISDNKIFEVEKAQLDHNRYYNIDNKQLTTIESSFLIIIDKEAKMWDIKANSYLVNLLLLDNMEIDDKVKEETKFIENDGIIKLYTYLSTIEQLRISKIYIQSGRDSIIDEANEWAGIIKGEILQAESKLAEKTKEADGLKDGDCNNDSNQSNKILLNISDSEEDIVHNAKTQFMVNPDEEITIIHPYARNILNGVYNKYGPNLIESWDCNNKVSQNFSSFSNKYQNTQVLSTMKLPSSTINSSESLSAQHKLKGKGVLWNDIITGSITAHVTIAAFLRVLYVGLNANTTPKLANYTKESIRKPHILSGIASLVLCCGYLESEVASKFLLLTSMALEISPEDSVESMDLLICLYITFWFLNSISESVLYILQESNRRALSLSEQLLCTMVSKVLSQSIYLLKYIQFSHNASIHKYFLEKSLNFLFSRNIFECLIRLILFDLQISIGSAHGTYIAHVPLMENMETSFYSKDHAKKSIELRELMRISCIKAATFIMEISSKSRYTIIESIMYQSIFRHFPIRRSFLFELLDGVNSQHYLYGVELYLSRYYKRNERILGLYPCHVFSQSPTLCNLEDEMLRNLAKPQTIIAVLTTSSFYFFEKPTSIRNVLAKEQYKYYEDPIVILKREYKDLQKIIRSFLGDQVLMLGWFSPGSRNSLQNSKMENIDKPQYSTTLYDIIICEKICDRDDMISNIVQLYEYKFSNKIAVNNDIISRNCLGEYLRIENIRAQQFGLVDMHSLNILNKESDDKFTNKINKSKSLLDQIFASTDIVFPHKKRFPKSKLPRAAILHNPEQALLHYFVITLNSVYEFEINWQFWFSPDSLMLTTVEDLYLRYEISLPLETQEIPDSQNYFSNSSKLGLANFLGVLDQRNEYDNSTQVAVKEKSQESKSTNVVQSKYETNVSLKEFNSESQKWFETRQKLAKSHLFKKIRSFRIHRLRFVQFSPLEEAEMKLIYQLPNESSQEQSARFESKKSSETIPQGKMQLNSSGEDSVGNSSENENNDDMTKLSSLQVIFLDDSSRERVKLGIALVINQYENSRYVIYYLFF
ncbi:leucine rich repeat family protein [Cryptosporidium andersoni]|uniref:Leucine rich repeat family protein n=1 Tax=Cryptosporidium andersoni TaxID=117008 RepID=A0A1J4MY94_9CRYT|nr:leucine rich repeat family protein [Cryptosporidium andersoni]